jgi:multisubunit Na+/H+ antiporter MnhC subunit
LFLNHKLYKLHLKQRGGLEPIITALILTGIVFGFAVNMFRKPDYTRG